MNNQITNIEKIALSGKRVFTTNDLAVLWNISDRRRLIELVKYYLRTERLKKIYKGVYGYGQEFSSLEIAQKIIPASYISLYTASQIHGLTFQFYETVFSISLKSKKYQIEGQKYAFHRVKSNIFYNQLGLVNNGHYTLADKERTITDCLYVFPSFAFDNLQNIDSQKLVQLSKIYQNQRLERAVIKLLKNRN